MAYTKRTKPTTTYVKRLRKKDWTWADMDRAWEDTPDTWEMLNAVNYTKRTKPTTTSWTEKTKPTTTYSKRTKP